MNWKPNEIELYNTFGKMNDSHKAMAVQMKARNEFDSKNTRQALSERHESHPTCGSSLV
jgi:hypothetical protein